MKTRLIENWIIPIAFLTMVVTLLFSLLYLGACAPIQPKESDLLPLLSKLEPLLDGADIPILHTFYHISEWRQDGRMTNRTAGELYKLLLEDMEADMEADGVGVLNE